MDDEQRAAYFRAKGTLACLQSADTDRMARTTRDDGLRYLAHGVGAAERHANGALA